MQQKIISSEADVRKKLEEGLSPEEVSLIHWKENLELMNMNKFKRTQIDGSVCALCYVHLSSSRHTTGGCENCPLKILIGMSCEGHDSVWHPIHKDMGKYLDLRDKKPLVSEKLEWMSKLYRLKIRIKENTMKMIATLEKLVAIEKERKKNEFRQIGRTIIVKNEFDDGKEFLEEYVELNNSGIFVPETSIHDGVFKISDNDTGEVYYGEKNIKEHTMSVDSETAFKQYTIKWYENLDTGEEYGATCSCPAFKFGTTRPCKHMRHSGMGEHYTDEVIDKRKPNYHRR